MSNSYGDINETMPIITIVTEIPKAGNFKLNIVVDESDVDLPRKR